MELPRHPGHEFVQGYGPGLPTCPRTLARLVNAYADFLRREAGQTHVPVDVDAIADEFGLTVVDADVIARIGLDGANVDALGFVLLSSEGTATRRRFTLAHELVEKLVAALRGNRLPAHVLAYIGETWRKERLCHWGAASILLPPAELDAALRSMGSVSLDAASDIATQFNVSLVVAAQAIAERHGEGHTALILWRLANKPSELKSGINENQGSLFGENHDVRPPKAARVWYSVFPRHLREIEVSVRHSSSPAGSLVHRALIEGETGAGLERLVIGKLDEVCSVDARRIHFGPEPAVVSLVRLPAGYRPAEAKEMFGPALWRS